MTSITFNDKCRLCLNSLGEEFTSIENPQFREQMDQVFSFLIIPQQGLNSSVCQNCTYTINEFYQYSQKVHCNQEMLIAAQVQQSSMLNDEIPIEKIKLEPISEIEFDEERLNLIENEEQREPLSTVQASSSVESKLLSDTNENKKKLPGQKNQEPIQGPVLNTEFVNIKVEPTDDEELNPMTAAQQKRILNGVNSSSLKESSNSHFMIANVKMKRDAKIRKFQEVEQQKRPPTNTVANYGSAWESDRHLLELRARREKEDQIISEYFLLTCYICSVVQPTFQMLREHFRTVHNSYYVYVTCCKEKFSTRSHLISHIRTHFDIEDQLYNYEKQPPRRTVSVEYEQLQRLKEKREQEDAFLKEHFTLICYMCKKVQPTFQALRDHFRLVHCSYNVYVTCCREKFSMRSKLIEHVKAHKKGGFDSKKYLRKEQGDSEELEKPWRRYPCKQCDKRYTTNRSLQRHIRVVHATQKEARVDEREINRRDQKTKLLNKIKKK